MNVKKYIKTILSKLFKIIIYENDQEDATVVE
jgi:hypothetical protein